MLRTSTAILVAAASIIALPAASVATTCNSVAACVLGSNTGTGVGVEGVSQTNVALYGVSTSNHGIDGRSRQSYGVVGYTFANGTTAAGARAGVYGIDSGTGSDNSGVLGTSTKGFGVLGRGTIGVAGAGSIGALFLNNDTSEPTIGIENESGGLLFEAENATAVVASIDGSGNEILAGTVTQHGSSKFVTRTSAGGAYVATYGARTSSPTLEDFGTAQLRNGATTVALDRVFASTIDARNYMVFITPHGNSNGLYAQTTPSGFTVRENNGGRATMSFDYRIVAKPLDAQNARLPAIAPATVVARKMLPQIALPTRNLR